MTDQTLASGAVVTVGCKLPHGLLMEMGKRGNEDYKAVQLRGCQSSRIVGGFGMTEVSEEFMTAWLKKYSKAPFVKKGMVFIMPDAASAADVAKERSEIKTGFERLNPKDAPAGLEIDEKHLKNSAKDLASIRRAAL